MTRPSRATSAPTSLRDFFDQVFLPEARRRFTRHHADSYGQAVRHFLEFCGGSVAMADVTDELLEEFAAAALAAGHAPKHRRKLAGRIRQVVRAWKPRKLRPPRQRVAPLPPPEPGTFRAYFESAYLVEAMIDCKPASIARTRAAFRELRRFAGRDVRLDEVNNALLANFLRWQREQGRPATTINSAFRATLLAVWNYACEDGAIEHPPRVRRLKEIRNIPDSWSLDQVQRILAAADQFRTRERYGRIRCHLWWRAMLLAAWWTGLRRAALLGIRREDVDRTHGTLYVPGELMKNRKAQQFRLGPDALDAIRAVWRPERELLFDGASVWVVNRHFAELLDAAGVRPGRRRRLSKFHKIRRTVCTQLTAQAGIAVASSLLGHSDSYVTQRYVDPTKAGGHDVTRILPRLIPDTVHPRAAAG